jgi:serine phosphatase RsbU (regulator of sigma subunit)
MTASQGFLHAALREHGDVERAVTELNAFIYPRRPASKFVTLWVGMFDVHRRTLSFVDAGHGYALLIDGAGLIQSLGGGQNVPIGVLDQEDYRAVTLQLPAAQAGARALVVSDGIIEQRGTIADGSQAQFELAGIEQFFRHRSNPSADDVADLFAAVIEFAGTDQLADDATAVLVRW